MNLIREQASIRPMNEADFPNLVARFSPQHWNKPHSMFAQYLDQQRYQGRRLEQASCSKDDDLVLYRGKEL